VAGGVALRRRAFPGRSGEALITTADLLAQAHGVRVDLFGELVPDQATGSPSTAYADQPVSPLHDEEPLFPPAPK
jgi:hypothetical protein